jgi:hypothetical protein
MRAALGYTEPAPDYHNMEKSPRGALENVGKWFPDHEVIVMCGEDQADEANTQDNVKYAGTWFDYTKDWNNYIIGFSYYIGEKNSPSHFVIGYPIFYGDMKASVCVCVKFKEVQDVRVDH